MNPGSLTARNGCALHKGQQCRLFDHPETANRTKRIRILRVFGGREIKTISKGELR